MLKRSMGLIIISSILILAGIAIIMTDYPLFATSFLFPLFIWGIIFIFMGVGLLLFPDGMRIVIYVISYVTAFIFGLFSIGTLIDGGQGAVFLYVSIPVFLCALLVVLYSIRHLFAKFLGNFLLGLIKRYEKRR